MKTGAWGRLRARPARRDAAIAGMLLALGIVLWSAGGGYPLWSGAAVFQAPPWAFLLTLGAICGAALLRSRWPFRALGLGFAVVVVDSLMGASLGVVFALTDLIYAALKYGSERAVRIAMRWALVGAVGLAVAVFFLAPRNMGLALMLFQWGIIVLISGLWGWNVRSERQLTRVELAAEHATDTRELRTRIAHDLHDLVANQIAVAGLHVEAAKLQAAKLGGDLGGDPAGDRGPLLQSLDRAKTGTDRAHAELRALISVLTVVDEVETRAPLRLGEELAGLGRLLPMGRSLRWEGAGETGEAPASEDRAGADRAGEAPAGEAPASEGRPGGVPLAGRPSPPHGAEAIRAALPRDDAPIGRIVVRVLQELVANAAKHGAGDVTVRAEIRGGDAAAGVAPAPAELLIELENALAVPGPSATPATGLGLDGTRVLVGGLGGHVDSTATPAGWLATLRVPIHTEEKP